MNNLEMNNSLNINQNVIELPQIDSSYQTIPSMNEMSKMTQDQLMNVENFTIKKDNVCIKFEGRINLVGANVKEYIFINQKNFEID